jgi:hypothetical protein
MEPSPVIPRRVRRRRSGRLLAECLVALALAGAGSALLIVASTSTMVLHDRATQFEAADRAMRGAIAEGLRAPCGSASPFVRQPSLRLLVELSAVQDGSLRRLRAEAAWTSAGVGAHERRRWEATSGTRCE